MLERTRLTQTHTQLPQKETQLPALLGHRRVARLRHHVADEKANAAPNGAYLPHEEAYEEAHAPPYPQASCWLRIKLKCCFRIMNLTTRLRRPVFE